LFQSERDSGRKRATSAIRRFHGKEKLLEFLTTNVEAFTALETEIRTKFQILPTVAVVEESNDEDGGIELEE